MVYCVILGEQQIAVVQMRWDHFVTETLISGSWETDALHTNQQIYLRLRERMGKGRDGKVM